MIISYKYKFIFIKTRKTAGSSICSVLEKYLGEDDIIDADIIDNRLGKNVKYHDRWSGHQTALWIMKRYPNEWKTFKKFTVERNPWEKIESCFQFYKKVNTEGVPDTLTEFLEWRVIKGRNPEPIPCSLIPIDWKFYTYNNKMLVNTILQYNELSSQFTELMAELQIPYQGELENTRIKDFSRKPNYKFNNYEDNLIKVLFQNEIKHFNYTKPDYYN